MMKHWLALTLLALVLVACGAPAPQLAPTRAPTSTPTVVPTPVPTQVPSPTVDPNMPAGATGKDADGRYFTVENGTTYYFLPDVFGNQEFESRMKNGPINLTGSDDSIWHPFTLTLDFNVYFMKDFEYAANGKYLVHPPGPSDYVKKNVAYSSAASNIIYDLFLQNTGLNHKTIRQKYNFNDPKEIQQYFDDVNALVQQLNNGKTINLGGAAWEPRKGFDEYWINEADAKNDPSMYFANGLYSKVTFVDGKLIAVMAAQGRDMFQDNIFRPVMLAPLEAATHGVSEKIWWVQYQDYGGATGKGASTNGQLITTETIELVP